MQVLIDVHAHYTPRTYTEFVARLAVRPPMGADGRPYNQRQPSDRPQPRTDDPDQIAGRISLMDEAGVQMQVLSHAVASPYAPKEEDAVEAARLCNDSYTDLVRKHPDRFAAFCALPLPHVDASLRELERGLDELGMAGVTMTCSALDESAADEKFDPIYEEMNRRGVAIFYHPSGNAICSPLLTEYRLNFAAGAPMEDTQIVAHLIARQMPLRYPNIKYIVPHFGGATPVLLRRFDNEMPYPELPEAPSETARRLYYDTVGHGSIAALTAAWEAFGPNQLVAGSDYPVLLAFEPYNETFDWIRRSSLPAEDIDKILNQNAGRILGIGQPSRA